MCLLALLLGSPTQVHAALHTRRQMPSRPRGDKYIVGVGKADITGPVVEIGMMGYASLSQKGSGLRQRIYSRAFLVANSTDATFATGRILYIIIDAQSGDTGIRHAVLEKLNKLYPGVYSQSNVALVGTHSHAGPGAWVNYLLPQVTTLGVDKQSFWAIVDGVVLSVKRAHESATTGYLYLGKGTVGDAGVNRSPYSYDHNPLEERQKYEVMGGYTDTEMQMLVFENERGEPLGSLNWFPTHGTSLYNNNTLISGDNKGYAAVRFEKYLRGTNNGRNIVTGFSQANVGDVSPNTLGAFCEDTGLPCKYEDSTCNGKSQLCHARGPGFRESDTESCKIIGERQFLAAKSIYDEVRGGGGVPVTGSIVKGIHTFVNFGQEGGYKFKDLKGIERRTCKAALGFSFAAGTSDGPGAFDFTQNDPGTPNNPLWFLIRNLLKAPSEDQVACHEPKPILLNVGEMDQPYAWSPNIVDIQLMRVGQLTMVVAPGEASTMAGRRWKAAVKDELVKAATSSSSPEPWVVIGGPANTYSHYIVTPEEYAVQRYEGASTLYGQYTLDAYTSLSLKYLPYITSSPPSEPVPPGPYPPINAPNGSLALNTGVVYDNPPVGKNFGEVLTQPKSSYSKSGRGSTVEVRFIGANPRNNLRLESDYAIIEKDVGGKWTRYRGDDDWEVTYEWTRKDSVWGSSEVLIKWVVSEMDDRGATEVGRYRVVYYGDAKRPFTGEIVPFIGTSNAFKVV
ncbi:Neutral/alkaline nonlysosomal ceramidase [Kalaharituber pfeilii]|nr:Neutral/alkaline nonlysosomal ceramidase [Kalaharituber pfeilii]